MSSYSLERVPTARRFRDQTTFLGVALLMYLGVSAAYTWPLLAGMGTALPSDPADPVFNAAILRWNATTLPFSAAWWNAPHYFPSTGVAAFTENLEGISLIATPVYWATGSAITAYNVAYFLTWPLSAIAACALVLSLSGRRDASLLAGAIFAFTPYRTAEIAHIQSLSVYWLPMVLLAGHRYLASGSRRWLWAFGTAWLLQSLSNGHYMLFGAVVIACWLVYFCSAPAQWRAGFTLIAAWAAASLPLVPVLLRYQQVHEQYGLERHLNEILAYSARPHSWFETTGDAWFWRMWLPVGKDDLFPGLVALALTATAALVLVWRHRSTAARPRGIRLVRGAAAGLAVVAAAATFIGLWIGPWSTGLAGVTVRMRDLNRATTILLGALAVFIVCTPGLRHAIARRSSFFFYTLLTALVAVFCLGPVVHAGDVPMLSPAPYRFLMALPGFDELRAPVRFWMLGVLSLSIAAGLGYATLVQARLRAVRYAAALTVFLLVVAEGWMPAMRLVAAPVDLALQTPPPTTQPLLELPLGVDWDWEAVYRASGHRRRVYNGVSGYDPPHYDALRTGLSERDPAMLIAMAMLGSFDVLVDRRTDDDDTLMRYVGAAPGARLLTIDATHALYRVPALSPEAPPGAPIAIGAITAMRSSELFATTRELRPELMDGRLDSGWEDYPQQPGQWVAIDLGAVQSVGGVTHALGRHFLAFPRRLEVQTSVDGQHWEPAWQGSAAAHAFLALVRDPLAGEMRFTFPARDARYVRLLQHGEAPRAWHVAELKVHRPFEARLKADATSY